MRTDKCGTTRRARIIYDTVVLKGLRNFLPEINPIAHTAATTYDLSALETHGDADAHSSLCSRCALCMLSLCPQPALSVPSLCSPCALIVLSLCSHCALTVFSLCSPSSCCCLTSCRRRHLEAMKTASVSMLAYSFS